MAMKSMKGLKGLDSEVAYLKKILSNPAVTTVTKGIGSFEMFEAYLQALNQPLTSAEDRALYRYAQLNRSSNCMLCDDCNRPVRWGRSLHRLALQGLLLRTIEGCADGAQHLSRYSARESRQTKLAASARSVSPRAPMGFRSSSGSWRRASCLLEWFNTMKDASSCRCLAPGSEPSRRLLPL